MPLQQHGEGENKVAMRTGNTKRKVLVVDASVGRAARNKSSQNQVARSCIQTLETIRKGHYAIAMSEEIENEWSGIRKNISFYASKWLVLMERRGRVAILEGTIDLILRENILEATINPSIKIAIRKDVHLLEAALATDSIIVCRDKKCRKYFQQAAKKVDVIKPIHWTNPELPKDDTITWLQSGAPVEAKRQLGYGGNTPKNTKKKTRKTTKQTDNL